MCAPPRHHARNVVARDLGDQLVRAEMRTFNDLFQVRPGIGRSGMMLADLLPVPASHVIEPQRGARRRKLRDILLGALALGRLYFFGFAPGRGLRRPVKAMTSEPEVEVPERRAPGAIDGHGGASFRV